jgi:hypothetical protein
VVAVGEGGAEGGAGEAVCASDVEGDGVGAQHHGDEPGVAGQSAGVGGGDLSAGVEQGGAQAFGELA